MGISVRMNKELTVVLGGTNAGHYCEMQAEGCRRGGKVREDGKPKAQRAVMLLIDLPVLPPDSERPASRALLAVAFSQSPNLPGSPSGPNTPINHWVKVPGFLA